MATGGVGNTMGILWDVALLVCSKTLRWIVGVAVDGWEWRWMYKEIATRKHHDPQALVLLLELLSGAACAAVNFN